MRRNRLFSAIYPVALLLLLLVARPSGLRASDGMPYNCEYMEGAHYRPNAVPHFEPLNDRLVLVDWTTGQDIFEVEGGISEPVVRVMSWSHDCRYLSGLVGTGRWVEAENAQYEFEWLGGQDGRIDWDDDYPRQIIIWDTVVGGRVFARETGPERRTATTVPTVLIWSPVENLAIIRVSDQSGFFHADTHTYMPITNSLPGFWQPADFRQGWYWDYGRNQLFIGGDLSAIDLSNGQAKPTCRLWGAIRVSPSAHYLAAFLPEILPLSWSPPGDRVLRLCDLDTLETWTLDYVGNLYPQQVAFSPDSRYLVVARDIIRVWDTSTRATLYTISSDVGRIERVTFVDAAHFQTVDIDGFVQTRSIATGEASSITDSVSHRG